MGIVVDLDPPERLLDAERLRERNEQLLLARGLGELARQRLARVAHRGVDEVLLFAPPRDADGDAVPGPRAQHLAKRAALGDRMAEQHEPRRGRSR